MFSQVPNTEGFTDGLKIDSWLFTIYYTLSNSESFESMEKKNHQKNFQYATFYSLDVFKLHTGHKD